MKDAKGSSSAAGPGVQTKPGWLSTLLWSGLRTWMQFVIHYDPLQVFTYWLFHSRMLVKGVAVSSKERRATHS
jgi:hypothetical protein